MFQVIWVQDALDELAAVWLRADTGVRRSITLAARQIDVNLARDPQAQGESREDQARILFAHPLVVTFDVDLGQSTVRVLHVWDIRRRPA